MGFKLTVVAVGSFSWGYASKLGEAKAEKKDN